MIVGDMQDPGTAKLQHSVIIGHPAVGCPMRFKRAGLRDWLCARNMLGDRSITRLAGNPPYLYSVVFVGRQVGRGRRPSTAWSASLGVDWFVPIQLAPATEWAGGGRRKLPPFGVRIFREKPLLAYR